MDPLPPGESGIDALNTGTQNLADENTLADGPPGQSRIDALNTATPNLADTPTLVDGPQIADIWWSRIAISHCY